MVYNLKLFFNVSVENSTFGCLRFWYMVNRLKHIPVMYEKEIKVQIHIDGDIFICK